MKVKIKKLNKNAVIPKYAKPGDGAMDLTAINKEYDNEKDAWVYDTGLAFEIPDNYVGLIFPRSSICNKNQLLTNHVGIIDSKFRGSVKFYFKLLDRKFIGTRQYDVGDRIGQIMILPFPQIEFEEVDELSFTERGTGGFGSTN